MKRAAMGIRMHSGWGVLVTLAMDAGEIELIDRRRVVVLDSALLGAGQPYHRAKLMEISEAGKYLSEYTAACERVALPAVRQVVEEQKQREYQVVGLGLVLASGRPLPALAGILASHSLIHTAEGELFRDLIRRAYERLEIPVSGFPERKLEDHAADVFGEASARIRHRLSGMGRTVGPPWTADHKAAALVALLILGAGNAGAPGSQPC